MTVAAILGGGAIGMLLAGKLAASGCPAELWTHTEEQARLIREQGLMLEGLQEDETRAVRIRAVSFAEVPQGFSGILLVALKQTAITDELLRELDGKLAHDAGLVLFQNGIGHAERFAEALPGRQIAVAVTTEAALRTGEASVRHTGRGETWIGRWPVSASGLTKEDGEAGGVDLPQKAVNMLKKAGFSAGLSNCIRDRMFKKLLINAVINPLTALWRIPNGELPAAPERLAVMQALHKETFEILQRHGFEADRGELWEDVLRVCKRTAGNRSSMLQDVLGGRKTEIDALNGAVCRLADQAGVPAPWNTAVTALVKAIPSP
jgi:2-dehydropantoate 2-reductase